jgi:uncharacterized protein (TIGR02246 family)
MSNLFFRRYLIKNQEMKSIFFSTFFFLLLGVGCAQPTSNSATIKNGINMNSQEKQAIETLLSAYESALNASDTKAVLELYAEDGVFMPSEAPTSIGKIAVEGAYKYVFSQIKLSIVFSIDEIEIHGDLAFARTISRGTNDVLAAGVTVPEENRELFVLKKENGVWKIARYIFNKMSPAKEG